MKDLDYYLSVTVDIEEDVADFAESESLKDLFELRYKSDSIIETIGTKECKFNILHFWDELIAQWSLEEKQKFAEQCFQKIIEVYRVETLKEYLKNLSILSNTKELKRILDFLELGYCVDVLVNGLEQNLLYNCDMVRQEALRHKGKYSALMFMHLKYCSNENLVFLVDKLISRYKYDFLSIKI